MVSGVDVAKEPTANGDQILIFRDRFVFNKKTGAFFITSKEGAFILRAALRGLTRKEIEREVASEFGVSASIAMSDTERFLLRLEEMHLVPGQMGENK